jgi:hypothetical protein
LHFYRLIEWLASSIEQLFIELLVRSHAIISSRLYLPHFSHTQYQFHSLSRIFEDLYNRFPKGGFVITGDYNLILYAPHNLSRLSSIDHSNGLHNYIWLSQRHNDVTSSSSFTFRFAFFLLVNLLYLPKWFIVGALNQLTMSAVMTTCLLLIEFSFFPLCSQMK